jgi:peptidoglycan hydrolase CwlO-like protein
MPLQKTVQDIQANWGARLDTMSTQIHGISDNLQETSARMGKLNQQLVALQNALRGIDAKLAHSTPPSAGTPAPAPPRVPPKR